MRKVLFLVLILIIILLWKPSGAWAQTKAAWAQRDRFLRVAVIVLVIYMIYGFYRFYQQGGIPGFGF
jgi:hypothetical protein